MIVVDTNVVVAYCLGLERSTAAEALWHFDDDWFAPALWQSELRNVVLQYIRHGRIDAEDGYKVIRLAEVILLQDGRTLLPDSDTVLNLALASGCTAYDCEYVAVARALGRPLATWDKALLKAFPDTCATPEALVDAARR